jgi:hypothetical protein
VTQSISPLDQATEMRARAAALDGPERDYYLWLAGEWDKSANRFADDERRRRGPRPELDQKRPRS